MVPRGSNSGIYLMGRYEIQIKDSYSTGSPTGTKDMAEFVKVVLNGQVIHEHVKMTKGTSSGALKKKEVPRGPLMFQGGLGAVAFRNIKVTHEKE